MCSVGDAFNIDIKEDVTLKEYKCNDCRKEFKAIGMGTIKCPACHSTNTSKKMEA